LASSSTPPFAWPKVGSAAVAIPTYNVLVDSPTQPEVPIASLTKLMTAFVSLKFRPLTIGEKGPSVTVKKANVAEYENDVNIGESCLKVVQGEKLTEYQLLEGLVVHSAGNYATMLADLVGGTTPKFVALMNRVAFNLGLGRTHYADPAGINPQSRSTADAQARLVTLLMQNPVFAQVASLSTATLPVVGTVGSYTPLIGTHGVVGVKSGITKPAGGCDILALQVTEGSSSVLIYAVVLGQQGADPLDVAGAAAYALAKSAETDINQQTLTATDTIGTVHLRTLSLRTLGRRPFVDV